MNRNLPDLSVKIDRSLTEIFEAIANVAESMRVPFFVVGEGILER